MREDAGMSEPVMKSYRGRLNQRDHGDAMDILFLGEDTGQFSQDDDPLASRIEEDMDEHGRYLSESVLRSLLGDGEGTRYHQHYSDITGYLWTDEDIMVGGHDLLAELRSHLGQWCLLEIDYSPVSPQLQT